MEFIDLWIPLLFYSVLLQGLRFLASLLTLVYVCGRGLGTTVTLPSPLAPESCITARIVGRTRFKFDKTLGSQAEP